MGDLFSDDIENRTYSDKMVLEDVRALVSTGQREGPLLDYKSDISDKDTWPASVAAFANSFGGLIVFGVEGKNDQPRRLTGFDPKGIEVKTKLTSMIIGRIQPRPDFSVRVVTYDQDTTKEVALLRVAEGRNPPYMHSKEDQHRLYIRVGAQKTEADYLQLSSLLEKREKNASRRVAPANEMFGSDASLYVPKPPEPRQPGETEESYDLRKLRGSNLISPEFFRFVLSPRNIGADLQLNFTSERQFRQCIQDVLGTPQNEELVIRSKNVTIFRMSPNAYGEQRFGLAMRGGIGFTSYPGLTTNTGPFFVPTDFCNSLLHFVCISSLFYERMIRFYGSAVLEVNIVTGVTSLYAGFPTPNEHLKGSDLFRPPLRFINLNGGTQIELAMYPLSTARLLDCLEAVLNDLVRLSGSVLDPRFRAGMQGFVDGAVTRVNAART
jgi:hypothetical protein